MMKIKLAIYLLLSLSLTMVACAKKLESEPVMVGNDRDAHGCIGSAGYAWCEKTAQCERSWELAKQKGFDLSDKAFAEFCKK